MAQVPDHFFRQSAVLPYRHAAGRLEILLITSRKRKRWVLPKGVREPHLDAAETAAREALEEAGIEGDLTTEPIGCFEYEKWGGTCSVQVFAMSVRRQHEDWLESHRRRQWLTPEEAAARVDEPALKEIIRSFNPGEESK